MRTNLLDFLCSKNSLSYIIFNENFEVLDSNNSNIKKGSDLREYLWELVGLEENILSLKDNKNNIEIPMISKDNHYYDLEINCFDNEDEDLTFIATLQEKSIQTHNYAKVIKEINKKTLIYETSDEKKDKDYNREINKHLVTFHVDLDGIITMVNDACLHFFNLEKDKMIDQHFSTFFQTQKSSLNTDTNIFIAKNSMNEDIFFHADIIPITNPQERVIENIIVAQDITYLKRVKKELEYAQEHDTLTGLANRHYFLKYVDRLIEKEQEFTICFLNIDNFKTINEEYGAHAADMLLKHLTTLLLESLEPEDLLMRLYGDNFAIIFETDKDRTYIEKLVENFQTLSKENPLYYNSEDTISFTYTTILLTYPKDVKTAKDFLTYQEKDMRRKKIDSKFLKR